jgi:hypothetical protein
MYLVGEVVLNIIQTDGIFFVKNIFLKSNDRTR